MINKKVGPSLIKSGIEFLLFRSLSFFPRLYWEIAPRYYRWRMSNDVEEFKSPPDPFKIEFVSPDRITQMSRRELGFHKNRRVFFGSVKDGDWDKPGREFEETVFHQSMIMHFQRDIPWEETPIFKKANQPREKSRNILFKRFEQIDNLYQEIESNGYQSQYKLLQKNSKPNKGLFLDTLDEVTVNVSRSGELLHVDGIHRLSIAKIQNIDCIPVVFLIRHRDWMEYREKVSSSRKIPDHPDLRDIGRKDSNERWKPRFM